jgi:hypothetical protein
MISIKRSKIGQARIIETFFAILIVSSSFIVSSYMIIPTNIPLVVGKGDLEKIGFNIFDSLAGGRVFEEIDFTQAGWEKRLEIVFEKILPSEIYFNLTVYNSSSSFYPTFINLEIINSIPITNVENVNEAFKKSPEIASITYVYTYYDWKTNKSMILVFILTLARPGEKK